ncbi:hypothetical protein QNH36_11575 [Mesobacillus sp. AQ2]|uniref:hypothetical protein n=1 Tax=Mesobacillus sp. AQ2 TaxID=3043332 RepID=UPI0024C18428|nr:hypothetical protein [Mesobacillus sp. AQ2]WHX42722.1 hypothetical protein QNH36_11575 [Mesobacillus sp. AQ2]
MKIRVGIVGPGDSVGHILALGREHNDLEMVPYIYKETKETENIIRDYQDEVDFWFFSGQAPYYYARSKGLIREDTSYFPPLYGSSLLGTLLGALLKEGAIQNASLDTIKQSELDTLTSTYYLGEINIHSFSYNEYKPAEEIISFHKKLHDEGKIEVAFTCVQEVHDRLKEIGIPCYRVIPSPVAIKLVLQNLKERGQSNWYKQSQIAIIGLEVIHSASSLDQQYFSYEMKRRELEIKQVMLDHAEKLQGSFVQIGDGLFFIYTTRGEMDMQFQESSMYSLIEEAKVHSKLKLRIGIGYGLTAYDAEQNVRLALHYAREKQTPSVVSVDEKKQINEHQSETGELNITYQQRKWGEEWEKRFKEAKISPGIVSKIEYLSRHYKKNIVTAQEVSRWLKRTERNSRRIMVELERLGLAKVTGEEQPGQRGRPRKVYELLF